MYHNKMKRIDITPDFSLGFLAKGIINARLLPDFYDENTISWTIEIDDFHTANVNIRRSDFIFSGERHEWSEMDQDWVDESDDLTHDQAKALAYEHGLIKAKTRKPN